MKTTNIFSKIFFAITIIGATSLLPSCDKDDDNDKVQTYTLSGDGSGTQESPAVTTTGSSTLSGTYNSRTNVMNYTISWTGITGAASAVRFYGPASVGANGTLVTDLTISSNGISGSASGNYTLTEAQEADLLNGKMYYNIHTVTHITGEVRGQVVTTAN